MRRGVLTSVIAATVLACGPAAAEAGPLKGAVARAERSPQLWATVNVCDTPRNPGVIGIRGQMPALGFPAAISMDIRVDYWSSQDGRFEPDPGASKLVKLGRVTRGVHQAGWSFQFAPHAGLLSGTVTFTWRLRGRVIGRVVRVATAGHRRVDGADPARFSASSCRIN